MKISKNYLMLISGIILIIAGFFVTKIGIPLLISLLKTNLLIKNIIYIILSIIIFFIFYKFIFSKLVLKHTHRIRKNNN